MADAMSDADKIRNKRLAKIAQQQQQQREEAQNQQGLEVVSSPSSAEKDRQSRPNTGPASATQGKSSPSPSQQSNSDAPRIKISPIASASGNVTPQKRELAGPGAASARSPSRAGETVQAWEDRTLRAVFRLTLDPARTVDANGHQLYYLSNLRSELENENKEMRISIDVLEQAIMEAPSRLKGTTPMDYLLSCWKRINRLSKGAKRPTEGEDKKFNIIQEARRLCVSWCVFAITTPDIFGIESYTASPLAQHLLYNQEDDSGICNDFLSEIVPRFSDDEGLKVAFVQAVEQMSEQLAKKSMDSDYRSYTNVLRTLVRYKPIAIAITESQSFAPKTVRAADVEATTLLGPYFQISPLQADVTKQYFSAPKTLDPRRISDAQRSLRMTLQSHQTELLDIINQLLRASLEARGRVLDWFALTVNVNHKREQERVDRKTVSSDGFMINITTILDQLCEPFMDASFSKLDRIDVDYLRRSPRVDIHETTKLNADHATSEAFYGNKVTGTDNFITEIFFLTLEAHHYGIGAAHTALKNLDKELKHMQKSLDQFELDRHKFVNNPAHLQAFETTLKKYKDQLDKGLSYKFALSGVLLDETIETRIMQTMRYVIVWLFKLVTEGTYPKENLSLPLPESEPETFRCLPEYYLEDICDGLAFITYNLPHILSSTQSDEVVMFCITFLRNSGYIKNPGLKAKLVSILFRGTFAWRSGARPVLAELYNSLQFATKYLLHSLLKAFIEAEHGSAHAFYDKFNIRYEIFQVIKYIWPNQVYKDQLRDESKTNVEFFVRFVNLLLNDVTYVLDESFSAFHTIHDVQQELNTSGSTMDQQLRQEKEEALSAAQSKAKSYMQLTNETVAMLKLFTHALADSFTMPEIVQRLADMLDYNLDAMVGPKSSNLKVENLQEYNFNPRSLLGELIDVYLNLSSKPNFILAVARDGRSYKPNNFDQATTILKKYSLKGPEELDSWEHLKATFKEAKAADEAAEQDLGEIPDEFEDPLMFTLMEDPVILPTSRVTMDRSTIRSHLLSDPNDPFNRQPLKIEDVIPNTELKARIESFIAERSGSKREFVQNQEDLDIMDTTTG
ncbi:putative ubiquitin fusion degradation protein [Phaeomoniella chlamydospora]|uniref:Putative ubiquitin fusion degradation protein n=1 Tax=Phaeomoniella chlamydospora TaxID=158046 RepID=A0A0G2E8H0_PHACM|nr:putative ubiquitin fusion degradation protein [Phaeomoniella chlamydospora]